jgi:hypothetical protein
MILLTLRNRVFFQNYISPQFNYITMYKSSRTLLKIVKNAYGHEINYAESESEVIFLKIWLKLCQTRFRILDKKTKF